MADNEAKALKALQEAEKKSKGTGGLFGGIFGGAKLDEACEAYVRAANLFKICKKWNEAGNAFLKAADLHLSKGEAKHDAATAYGDAANCFKKSQPQNAVDCLKKAAEIYTDMGRFTMAAKHYVSIAEMFESECPDQQQAMIHYEKAGDFYKGEESKSSANKCYQKVAEYAALLEQYPKAIQIFEEVGASAADSSLLKYSAKDHFFRALICHLCVDILNAQHSMKKYENLMPSLTDTREFKLIKELIGCCEESDPDKYTEAVKEYDKISRMDSWHTTLLLRVKRSLGEGGEDDLR